MTNVWRCSSGAAAQKLTSAARAHTSDGEQAAAQECKRANRDSVGDVRNWEGAQEAELAAPGAQHGAHIARIVRVVDVDVRVLRNADEAPARG